MAGWFDSYAKKSAQRTESVHIGRTSGISRRRVIVGGTAAVGAAWTAPILMASPAAALGRSACPSPGTYCTNGDPASAACCAPGSACDLTGGVGGLPGCVGQVGGPCGNSGNGRGGCNLAHCNGNDNTPDECQACADQPICGGESALCNPALGNAQCAQEPSIGFLQTCSNANNNGSTLYYCRHQCTADSGCAVGQFCDSNTHFCAKHCTKDNQCMSPGLCVTDTTYPNGICVYTATT